MTKFPGESVRRRDRDKNREKKAALSPAVKYFIEQAKRVQLPATVGRHLLDKGARSEARPADVVIEPASRNRPMQGAKIAMHASDWTIDRYMARGWITDREHQAGTELREAWEGSTKEPRVTARLDGGIPGGSGADDALPRVIAAKKKLARGLRSFFGLSADVPVETRLRRIEEFVVLEDVVRRDGNAGRRMNLLRDALGRVGDAYGLEKPPESVEAVPASPPPPRREPKLGAERRTENEAYFAQAMAMLEERGLAEEYREMVRLREAV